MFFYISGLIMSVIILTLNLFMVGEKMVNHERVLPMNIVLAFAGLISMIYWIAQIVAI